MKQEKWYEIEKQIREKLGENTLGLCEWRYCFECTSFRPPRSHHCSQCGECVLRFDHHCPFVANCVGIKNHKLFWNFLLNSLAGCLVVSAYMAVTMFQMGFWEFYETKKLYFVTLSLALVLISSLGGLFCVNTWMMLNNYSTLEMNQLKRGNVFLHKKKKILSSAKRKNKKSGMQLAFGAQNIVYTQKTSRWILDSDFYRCWTDVMGPDWKTWLLPFPASDQTCNGYEWKLYPTCVTV